MLRRPAILATALGCALASTIALAGPAAAADSWTIPARATITIQGRGFGHGIGLSQYGARQAARTGKTYRQIVGTYYPRTTWGTATGSVRVWITRDLTNDVQVAARSRLVASRVGAKTSWNLTKAKPRATRWRINPRGDRTSVLQYLQGGWHTFRTVSGLLQFSAAGKPIRLFVDGGSTSFRGVLRSVPSPSTRGNRLTINMLPLETYLRGVVPAEMVASTLPQQALRAQAVAARTYAVHERAARRTSAFDVRDTAASQAYGGASAEYSTSDAAVKATHGQILKYGGKPAYTQFTASSGGWTVDGGQPYLPAKADPFDSTADPNHSWTVRFTDTELERAWPQVGDLQSISVTSRDGNGQWGGRVRWITLSGKQGSQTVSGDDFYQRLHLRSAWLNLSVRAR